MLQPSQPPAARHDGVHRARSGRIGIVAVHPAPSIELEGQGDVQALARVEEAARSLGKAVDGRLERAVGQILASSARELGVDRGRQAVPDRVADDRVAIRHRSVSPVAASMIVLGPTRSPMAPGSK